MKLNLVESLLIQETFLATGFSSPNPPVASATLDCEGRVLDHAHTQAIGGNHSERQLYSNSRYTDNYPPHDLYVTLEPCSHFGRTPPCRDIIFKYKPRNLIIGNRDPNPLVEKYFLENINLYKNMGINLVYSNKLRDISYPFLNGYFSRIKKSRPKILIKTAVTKEGYYCPLDKKKILVSNLSSTPFLHLLRAKVDGIIVGMGSILNDNPSLDFRISESIDDSNLQENLSNRCDIFPNSHDFYWEALLTYSKNELVWKIHKKNLKTYQPKRIFLIEREPFGNSWDCFIKIQNGLKQKYSSTEVIFILKNSIDSYTSPFLNNLEKLGKIFYLSLKEKPYEVLEILANEGINHLLVEGGNSLYKMFYHILEEEDEILIVRNNSLSWKRGILPYFWDKLKNHKLKWDCISNLDSRDDFYLYSGRV